MDIDSVLFENTALCTYVKLAQVNWFLGKATLVTAVRSLVNKTIPFISKHLRAVVFQDITFKTRKRNTG